jgi:cobyrinic acid a,c-diamide synthase
MAARAQAGRDILVIEGVMGLFDGAFEREPDHDHDHDHDHDLGSGRDHGGGTGSGSDHGSGTGSGTGSGGGGGDTKADSHGDGDGEHTPGRPGAPAPAIALASTASVAALTDTPVILVVDAAAMNQSVAALVHGYATWSRAVPVRGVILNRVGSDAHEEGLRRALADVDIFGVLRRDPALAWRDRHLGLVPVAERPHEIERSLGILASAVEAGIDLDAVVRLAGSAPSLATDPLPPARHYRDLATDAPNTAGQTAASQAGATDHDLSRHPSDRDTNPRPRIAIAAGPAFTFVYPETLERLEEAGAELVPIDPLQDGGLPAEVDGLYAGGGFPEVYAERLEKNTPMLEHLAAHAGAGMPIWAECGGLLWLAESLDGHRLAGVVAAAATMTTRLTLGYRTAHVRTANPVVAAGTTLRGHEFHYSQLEPPGDALDLANHREAWREGHASPSLLATYLHLHLGADAGPAERFVWSAASWHAQRTRRHAVG